MSSQSQNGILRVLGEKYKQWIENLEPEFQDFDDFDLNREKLSDSSLVWTYVDFWDPIETDVNGESVFLRGAGFVQREPFEEEWADEPMIAITASATQDDFVFSEVLISCENCSSSGADEDCDFCFGELEARFQLRSDGASEQV
jgi:hypothetical protein